MLADHLNERPAHLSLLPISGGDIHSACRVSYRAGTLFVKFNTAQHADVLASEYASLVELEKLKLDFYPQPLHFAQSDKVAVLLMQYHDLVPLTESSGAGLAKVLAEQHSCSSEAFGWPNDNFIGRLPQANTTHNSWAEFFIQRRLLPQCDLAERQGLRRATLDLLDEKIQSAQYYLSEIDFDVGLVHGDLWSGNAAYDNSQGRPVLFDPAPYYGDPDVDISMTELFGGFPNSFYKAYRRLRPEHQGYSQRMPIYNLYHALNHFNHFGAGYEPMILSLCKAIR